jgi:hypothetical protein
MKYLSWDERRARVLASTGSTFASFDVDRDLQAGTPQIKSKENTG